MHKGPFNLGETLEVARKNFAGRRPLEMAANSGCLLDMERNIFTVPFLGEKYLAAHPSGQVTAAAKGVEAPTIVSILILHYLDRASGVEEAGSWISFKELQGGGIYIEPFQNRAVIPFVRNFGGRPEAFATAAATLGGHKAEHGNISYIIPVLPRVKLLYILWYGDDEFPANGTILFDRYANTYLHTEDFAFLAGMTVGVMLAALKKE
ncbi:MAG: DUF3786 domain-containing protein [Dethiobacter sp.]|jgi:hypothetical protein|nr:DUF3786 domain-containing protein [Dethiobacter sp.]